MKGMESNKWCFRAQLYIMRLYWATDNLDNEINFGINNASGLGSLDKLTCSPENYHCVTATPNSNIIYGNSAFYTLSTKLHFQSKTYLQQDTS